MTYSFIDVILCEPSIDAVGGKTSKTSVLPWFWEIERAGNGSVGAQSCYGGLSRLKFSVILGGAPAIIDGSAKKSPETLCSGFPAASSLMDHTV